MSTKRLISMLLIASMLFSLCLTACTSGVENNESESTSERLESSEKNNTESSDIEDSCKIEDTLPSEGTSDDEDTSSLEEASTSEKEIESEEETTVITDVMIGETLEAEYAADFTVARVFSNDMVVQRREHIRVWGFAPESENGKKVSGEFKGMFAEALVENGEWCLTFGARLEADVNGAEMKIYTDKKTVTFEGVLVGDVYLVMGQSNANYSVSNHFAYTDSATQGGGEAAIDPNSIIRLNHLNNAGGSYDKAGTDYVYSDLTNTIAWTKTTTERTTQFSALGYYFARHLTENDPTVPVGVMQLAKGGAPIVSFLPNDLADKWQGDYLNENDGLYYSNVSSDHLGRYFYNCYLSPISRYAIAGIVWYQGESNNSITEAMKYNETFADLMTRLRSTHNVINKDFPVFITELPTIYQKPSGYTGTWHFMELGMIRSYMGSIPTILENSYVAASSDLWADREYYNNLHPNCKYEQAERLSDLATVVVNKNGTLDEATGPVFKNAVISADKKTVVITFTNVGQGITTKDGGNAVLGIIGLREDSMGHVAVNPISATVTDIDQITVVFDVEVKAVAYNYQSEDFYGETINLCNSFGCPAPAFLSSYTEREIGNYAAEDFFTTDFAGVQFKRKSIDTLTANGKGLFPTGGVLDGLAAAGNRVEVQEGTAKLSTYGWIAFGHKIIMLGYSIDGGDAIFNTYPTAAGAAVINAGGQYAKRFTINMDISRLVAGDHTVDVLALVDVKDGVAVKFLSFTVSIVAPPTIPDGFDAPAHSTSGYGFVNYSLDMIKIDATALCSSGGHTYLKNCEYTLTASKGSKTIRLYGWTGYQNTIDKLGYAVNGNATIETSPNDVGDAIKNAGGANAKRFDVFVDISGLDVGYHTIDLLVRINMEDGSTAVLKITSFTLIIQ